jgi:uncharacterized protein YjbI with pentapeptide repeats
MRKSLFSSISCALLASFAMNSVLAEDASATCAEWKSNVAINVEALDKLQRNNASDKPSNGYSYTKNQFVVLLGKNLAGAREMLANNKNKLPKTDDGRVDLRDVTLNGFNLSGLDLSRVDFKGAEMNGADLSGSNLREASLYKTELEDANLNNSNLSLANLSKAKLVSASLCHATLAYANLEDANFNNAYVKNAKFDLAKKIPRAILLNAENVLHFGLPVPEL